MRKLTLLIVLIVGCGISHAQAQSVRTMTLDSWMVPSAGEVNDLIFYPQPTRSGSCVAGTVYYDATDDIIKVCNNAGGFIRLNGVWTQSGADVYPTDAAVTAVGIGTQSPNFMLHVGGDGTAVMEGTFGSSAAAPSGAGTRFMWLPNKAAVRGGRVTGTQWDDGNIGADSIVFGYNNEAQATYSSISGGSTNLIETDSFYSVIGGGLSNTITDLALDNGYNVIGGGQNNTLNGKYQTIGGGEGNSIAANSDKATIAGGQTNAITGTSTGNTIGGGFNNNLSGLSSNTIAGGSGHDVAGGTGGATVSGGMNNDIVAGDSSYSTISGGRNNIIRGQYNVISGGNGHNIDSLFSTIGGGDGNNINDPDAGRYNTIAGGFGNRAEGRTAISGGYATVGGGMGNRAIHDYATVAGGQNNTAAAIYSTIPGGESNGTWGDYSWAGGRNMGLNVNADRTFLWGHSTTPTNIGTSDAFIIYSGNVGIGITNPTQKLHVNAIMKLEPLGTPPSCNEAGLLYASSDGSGALCFCADGGGTWLRAAGTGNCN